MAGSVSHFKKRLLSISVFLAATCCFLFADVITAAAANAGYVQEKVQSEAEKVFIEADELFKLGTRESLVAAIIKYQVAVEKWQRANRPDRESEALTRIAVSYFNLDEYGEALKYYNKSLDLSRGLGDRSGEAQALNGIGRTYWSTGEFTKALDFYTQSLAPRRAAGNRIGEGFTLGNIGAAYWAIGQGTKAFEFYRQALAIMQETHSQDGQAFILYNLGLAYASRAESAKALQHYEEALRLERLTQDHRSEASTLNNIGLVYTALGDFDRALEYLNEALSIRRTGAYRPGIAITLRNIGDIYARLGKPEKALGNYLEAIPLSEAVGDRRGKAYTLDSIGVVYWKMRDYEKAQLYLEKAIALFREITHKTGIATSLADIGPTYVALGKTQAAMDCYEEALSLFRETLDRAGELRTLYEIALLKRSTGKLANALSEITEALNIAELVRGRVGGQELRASYFATVQDYYDLGIDILMRLHKEKPAAQFDRLALQISERSRARSLLDTLAESNVDIHKGAEPQLIQEERRLLQELNEKRKALTQLLSDKHDSQTVSRLDRDIEDLTNQYEDLELRLKQSKSTYTDLTRPVTLAVNEIQEQLLDSNTLLLEYALGPDRSYLWAVTNSSVLTCELPKQSELELLARELNESVRARNLQLKNESAEQRADRLTLADAQYLRASKSLSRALLGPVMTELEGKRLIIVAEGALQTVPFAALPILSAEKEGKVRATGYGTPLVVEHETVNLPSASILGVLRNEVTFMKKGGKKVIIFADPVFGPTDSRIQSSSSSSRPSKFAPQAVISEPNEEVLPRLVFSREEAQAILALVQDTESKMALDFEASGALAKSSELKNYNIVHFATHTRIDSDRPERSEVILSRYDKSGNSLKGSLSLADIYNLNLSAQLVVLSGCETALGKELRGEGLMGLTRGFMYAGAPRVVSTLWRIDDRVTSELMRVFYEGLFKRGLSPAKALQEAQIAIWRKRNWEHPYYWAAFALQGEPNKMN